MLRVREDFYESLLWNTQLLTKEVVEPIDLRLALITYRFFGAAAIDDVDVLYDKALAECTRIWARSKRFQILVEPERTILLNEFGERSGFKKPRSRKFTSPKK